MNTTNITDTLPGIQWVLQFSLKKILFQNKLLKILPGFQFDVTYILISQGVVICWPCSHTWCFAILRPPVKVVWACWLSPSFVAVTFKCTIWTTRQFVWVVTTVIFEIVYLSFVYASEILAHILFSVVSCKGFHFYCVSYNIIIILTLLTPLTLLTILVPVNLRYLLFITYNTYILRNITYSTIVTFLTITNTTNITDTLPRDRFFLPFGKNLWQ